MKTAAILLALFGLVSAMDYEDQEAERQRYCEMVKTGYWPDFKGAYLEECPITAR